MYLITSLEGIQTDVMVLTENNYIEHYSYRLPGNNWFVLVHWYGQYDDNSYILNWRWKCKLVPQFGGAGAGTLTGERARGIEAVVATGGTPDVDILEVDLAGAAGTEILPKLGVFWGMGWGTTGTPPYRSVVSSCWNIGTATQRTRNFNLNNPFQKLQDSWNMEIYKTSFCRLIALLWILLLPFYCRRFF